MIKVLFGIPNEGGTVPEAYDNRMEMVFYMGQLQMASRLGLKELEGEKCEFDDQIVFYIASIGNVFTALAREKLADIAIQQEMDYLFMVDDDMIVPQDLFSKLYRHKVDIVAPLAFMRLPPYKPVIYNVHSGYDKVEKKSYFINYIVEDYPEDTLVKCDAVGFGAVLIKVDVFRKMKKNWFMSTTSAGEDIFFCWKAGEAGFSVYMDTSVKLGHLTTPTVVTEETYKKFNNKL